jgi:anti-sigma factor RsiW
MPVFKKEVNINDSDRNSLIRAGLHRQVTAAERAHWENWLRAHPDDAAECEMELALNRALRQLPDKPVASNFTDLVLQAVVRESKLEGRPRLRLWESWLGARGWISKIAVTAVIVSTGVLSYYQYQVRTRLELARSVAQVSGVTSLLNAEVLQNFDVINRLAQVPAQMDDELYLALK